MPDAPLQSDSDAGSEAGPDTGSAAAPAPRERVFYRDDEAFRNAMHRAVGRISRHQRGRESLRYAVLFVLIAIQVILVGAWIVFDLDLSTHVINGMNIGRPVWLVLIVYVIGWVLWSRRRHRRIVAQRLCLECGTPLLEVATDDSGDGTCPECQRAFNLGEYRPPSENRGRDFHGYVDAEHFDLAMRRAAVQLREHSPTSFGALLTYAWIALGVSFALSLITGYGFIGAWIELLGVEPGHGILSGVLGILTGIHALSLRRLRRSIAPERRCFGCGYSLLHTPTDDDGIGRCPECGTAFALREYVRPDDQELRAS